MPKINPLSQMIMTYSNQCPDKIALICNQEKISYRQLFEVSSAITKNFAKQVPLNSRVILHLPNSLELIYAYFGCLSAGLTAVPISVKLKTAEIKYILEQTNPTVFISHYKYLTALKEMNFHNKYLKKLFIIKESERVELKWNIETQPFDDLVIYNSSEPFSLSSSVNEAMVFFTSGSTGVPKGVVHSHSSLYSMAENIAYCVDLSHEDRFYVSEALTNTSGFTHVMSALCKGATAILAEEINNIPNFVRELHLYRPTVICIMGKANIEIINDPTITADDFQSVRINLTGGDKITRNLLQKFKAKTKVPLRQGYGMSEVLCITVNKSLDSNKQGSIGTATKDVTIYLMDKSGKPVSSEQVGEVFVSGPNVMLKYWNDEALTKKTIINGMLRTGDLAYRDQDGYYWFYGRLKQLIIREGNNISPFEIEEVLMQHEAVKVAGVTGKPDPLEGEVPIAFVVLKQKQVTGDELLAFAAKRLEEFKLPVAIYIINQLPLTKSNKIDRNKLKELI